MLLQFDDDPAECVDDGRVTPEGRALSDGYPIAGEAFDLELFGLLSAFAGSPELSRLSESYPGVANLRVTFDRSEAARRLLVVGAMVRNALDTWASRSSRTTDAVGDLIADILRPTERGTLTLREACNKILHADEIDLDEHSGEAPGALSRQVRMYGRRGDQAWEAHLDVIAFVESACRLDVS